MSKTLVEAATETIAFLNDQKVIGDKDSLTVAIIMELCAEWPLATTSTQRAAISKEIRNTLAALPEAPAAGDPVDGLLDDIANA